VEDNRLISARNKCVIVIGGGDTAADCIGNCNMSVHSLLKFYLNLVSSNLFQEQSLLNVPEFTGWNMPMVKRNTFEKDKYFLVQKSLYVTMEVVS